MTIIDFIDKRRDLYHLCRTSSLLRSVAEPKLYGLHLRRSERAKKMDIRSIIVHPRLEILVNTLFLRLNQWYPSTCTAVLRVAPPCRCDKLDEALGRALSGLLHLKRLRLECSLCSSEGPYERHQYLATLQTSVLNEVKFYCKCSDMDEVRLLKYIGAPCMTPVTTLGWSTCGRVSTSGYLRTSLTGLDILPNLRTLFCVPGDLNHLLLQCRPIQKIGAFSDKEQRWESGISTINHEDVINRRDELTHVCVRGYSDAANVIRAISADPLSFRNLQHLGTFHLDLGPYTIQVRIYSIY
jgi:hypothetical protein